MIISREQYIGELRKRVTYPRDCCPMFTIEPTEIWYWLLGLGIAEKLEPILVELKKRPNQMLMINGKCKKSPVSSAHCQFLIHGTENHKLSGKGLVIMSNDGHQECAQDLLDRFMIIAIRHAEEHGLSMQTLNIK